MYATMGLTVRSWWTMSIAQAPGLVHRLHNGRRPFGCLRYRRSPPRYETKADILALSGSRRGN